MHYTTSVLFATLRGSFTLWDNWGTKNRAQHPGRNKRCFVEFFAGRVGLEKVPMCRTMSKESIWTDMALVVSRDALASQICRDDGNKMREGGQYVSVYRGEPGSPLTPFMDAD
jgi:hypothetical protein